MADVLEQDHPSAGRAERAVAGEYVGHRDLVPTPRQQRAAALRAESTPERPRGRTAPGPAQERDAAATDVVADAHPAGPAGDDRDPAAGPSRIRGWLAAFDLRGIEGPKLPLLVLSVGMMTAGLGGGVLSVAAPEIQASFGTSVAGLATIASITGTITLLIGLPLGYLVDRVSRVRLIQVGAFLTPLGTISQAASGSFGTFTAGQTAIEIAGIPGDGAQDPLLADYYRSGSRARVYGFLAMIGLIAGLVSTPLLGWLVQSQGWRRATVVLSVIGLVGAASTLLLREPKRGAADRLDLGLSADAVEHEPPPPRFSEALRGAWAIRSLRLQAIAGFVGSFSAPLSILLSLVLASKFALGPFERSLLQTVTVIATFPAILIGTAVADRLMVVKPASVVAMQAGVGFVSSLAMVGQAFAPNLAVFVALSVLPAALAAAIEPVNATVYAMIVPARYRGVGMQVFTPFALIGTLVAPVLLRFAQGVDLQHAFVFFAPFMVLSSLLYLGSAGYVASDIRAARAAAAAQEVVLADGDDPAGRILVIRDLCAAVESVTILDGIDLDIRRGELLALTGTNGAGKSTLLRAVCGLQPASNGAIFFRGRDVTHNSAADLAGRGLTYVPGGEGVFSTLTVRQNLLAARAASGRAADDRRPPDPVALATAAFPALADRLDTLAGDLSGGEQQMVALAQAFAMEPQLLLIDELSLGLSTSTLQSVLAVLRRLNDAGTTIVFVEQSLNVAGAFADRVVYLDQGRIVFDGPGRELLDHPGMVRSVFLGAPAGGRRVGVRRAPRETPDGPPGAPVLDAEALSVSYGGVQALSDVSLALRPGEVVGILGHNGAGKTTLFDVLSGYHRPSGGVVRLNSTDVAGLSPHARARLGLARAFQDARLFGALTVLETVELAFDQPATTTARGAALRWPGHRAADADLTQRSLRLIETFGLTGYADAFIGELSTGTRRAVEIACLMAREPRVVLLDEPSSGLAQAEVEALGPALRRIVRDLNCAVLLIEHDLALIGAVSDRLIVLDHGRVVAAGATEDVLTDPTIAAGFLSVSDTVIHRSGSGHIPKRDPR